MDTDWVNNILSFAVLLLVFGWSVGVAALGVISKLIASLTIRCPFTDRESSPSEWIRAREAILDRFFTYNWIAVNERSSKSKKLVSTSFQARNPDTKPSLERKGFGCATPIDFCVWFPVWKLTECTSPCAILCNWRHNSNIAYNSPRLVTARAEKP